MENPGSSNVVQAPMNPLLNSLILSEVFSHVDGVEDLKNIRLVCGLWWEISLKKWRNSASLRLSLSKKPFDNASCDCCPPRANKAVSQEKALDVEIFMQIARNPAKQEDYYLFQLASKPFRHYTIENCCLSLHRYSDDDETDALKRLLRVCGPHVKFLNLDHCFLFNDRFAQFFTRILSKQLTNLEELSVVFVSVERGEGVAPLEHVDETENKPKPVPMHAPRLKKLTVGRCENNRTMVMPTGEEWREFFHYVPNLKDLTVDTGALCSVQELQHPSITGHPIRLLSLTMIQKGRTLQGSCSTDGVWTVAQPSG